MVHHLKTINPFFKLLKYEKKLFEVRKFDRPYKVNDVLMLQEFDEQTGEYSGDKVERVVDYVLLWTDFPDGIQPGYCVISLRPPQPAGFRTLRSLFLR